LLVAFWACSGWTETPAKGFRTLHQAGFRLGGWANLGDTPVKTATSGTASYDIDFKGGAFYFEGFVGIRFSPHLMGELSLGIFNRGEVNLQDGADQFFGNLLVYPMLLRAKVYPFATSTWRLQPYLTAGGGFYYARHSIQFYQSNQLFRAFNETRATSFDFTLGGGFDLPVASKLALELNCAYLPLGFSKELITIKNYDGLTITVGMKYLFSSIR
jgi:opacity protein-like surface antigen